MIMAGLKWTGHFVTYTGYETATLVDLKRHSPFRNSDCLRNGM